MKLSLVGSIFSGVVFLFYGINCFRSEFLKSEFVRFGLANFRKLTGALQILGGSALLLGLYTSNLLAFLAATGLSLLMALGFALRLKLKDSFIETAPSLLLAMLNAYLAWTYWQIL
ncbi:MAG: DoxX family protein [Winogradskyella sp.]|nr:DoxX family protein [Winogradskyella sp.]